MGNYGMAQRRTKPKSEYGLQLQEKQKMKEEYGLRERQFRRYFDKGQKPDNIFALLELRLDSFIYASGFAITRASARQMVSHGHVLVNDKRVTVASYEVTPKDIVTIKENSRKKGMFADFALRTKSYKPPSWLAVDKKKMEIKLSGQPDVKEQITPFNFQTIIEFYSR